ncbi:hypothetical protein JB92DRAFT_790910 [Gautieria morchelliformis]|nr:hypothetical protein JB92DRAFT_790910 [Gautieria morchelliformis]
MDHLTVDLRQSLQWVLLLPSLTSLTFRMRNSDDTNLVSLAYHAESLMGLLRTCVILPSWQFQDLLTQGDQEDDEPRERSHLSHLNLELAGEAEANLGLYVDWFLGPRSPFEISHIQNLRIDLLDNEDEKALNRLLRAIGSSLVEVGFYVPNPMDVELAFNIKLEYNSNIRVLSLTNINIEDVDAVDSGFGTAWLLRFLSNFDASNKIERIRLQVIIFDTYTFEEAYSAAGWGQVDCILAEKFRKLEELDIQALVASTDPEVYSEIDECMLDAHPMLHERGVPVAVWCTERS